MQRGLRADSPPPAEGFSPCNLSWLFISCRLDCLNPDKAFGRVEEHCSVPAFLSEGRRKAGLLVHLLTPPSPLPRRICRMPSRSPVTCLPTDLRLRVASIPGLALGQAGGLWLGCYHGANLGLGGAWGGHILTATPASLQPCWHQMGWGDGAGEIPLLPIPWEVICQQLPVGARASPPAAGDSSMPLTGTTEAHGCQPALLPAQSRAGTISEILVPSSGTSTNDKAEHGCHLRAGSAHRGAGGDEVGPQPEPHRSSGGSGDLRQQLNSAFNEKCPHSAEVSV